MFVEDGGIVEVGSIFYKIIWYLASIVDYMASTWPMEKGIVSAFHYFFRFNFFFFLCSFPSAGFPCIALSVTWKKLLFDIVTVVWFSQGLKFAEMLIGDFQDLDFQTFHMFIWLFCDKNCILINADGIQHML